MNYLIIGASAAGISCVEAIRSIDMEGKITVVSDENYPVYSRCMLSYYLAGIIPEGKLKYREDDFYRKFNVNAIIGKKVDAVMSSDKKVKLSDGSVLTFDKLLIATGSRSKMEKIPGIEKEGVFGLRNIDDARKIEKRLQNSKAAVMLGGGLIGLRAAYALHKRGIKVTVVVKSKHVLSQMLDEEGAKFIQDKIEKEGIKVLTGLAAKEILGNKCSPRIHSGVSEANSVSGVVLENGEKIDCQIVIIGKGVQANMELVKNTEIKTEKGIVVNDYLRTTVSDIYAAGDVAQANDLITGESTINALWPNAVIQGKIAGFNMVEKNIKYDGSISMNSVEFFELPTISCGITKPKGEEYEILVRKNIASSIYRKIILKDNKIVGFVLVKDVDKSGIFGLLLKKKINVSSIKEVMMGNNFDFAKIIPLIKQYKSEFAEKEYSEILI
ncbi:MAG: NAD(P)/FAD-dependent oxidoreductase [Elusimicrobia bacterium]|nr:NAD(P)/FAD-dependent oxidoreductase [Elusimicrobiota bacterium]